MKLTNYLLQSLPNKKYLEKLPNFKEKRLQRVTTLIFTLIALSFFGFFAINPTVSTIFKLQKQLRDYQETSTKLEQKITNLGILGQKYTQIEKDIPTILLAVPQDPAVPTLTGEIITLARQDNLSVIQIQSHKIELTNPKNKSNAVSSFDFTTEVEGSYENIIKFTTDLITIERVLTIDSLSLTKGAAEGSQRLSLRGKAYFKK